MTPAYLLSRDARSQILRSVIERMTDARGRPAAIRRVAARLDRSPNTLKAWMSNSSQHLVPWLEIELLRLEDALLFSGTFVHLPVFESVRTLYERSPAVPPSPPAGSNDE